MVRPVAPAEIAPTPSIEQAVPVGHYAEIPLNAQPVDTISNSKGQTREVLAWVDLPHDIRNPEPTTENATRIAICKPLKRGRNAAVTLVDYQEDVITGATPIAVNKSAREKYHYPAGSRSSITTSVVKRPGKTSLLIGFGNAYAVEPTITTAENAATIRQGDPNKIAKRAEKRGKLATKAAAAVTAYAMLSSGGIVDHAGEVTNDAAQEVRYTYSYTQKTPHNTINAGWMDDYNQPDAPSHQAAAHEAAVDTTAEAMEALDTHNTAKIEAQAKQFVEAHRSEILTNEQTAAYREQLDNAKTPEEAIGVLNSFMQFFGKKARLQPNDPLDNGNGMRAFDPSKNDTNDVRAAASEVIDAFSPLPAFMVRGGDFTYVSLTGAPAMGLKVLGGEVVGDSIMLPLRDKLQRSVLASYSYFPDALAPPADNVHPVIHELGHTWDKTIDYGYEEQEPTGKMTKAIKFIGQKAVLMNGDTSIYAAVSPEHEKRAENFATAFDVVSTDGLAHPDEWRRFNSGSNKQAMAVLIGFEKQYPGLTWYVVSKRLAKRSVVQTPLIPFVNAQ